MTSTILSHEDKTKLVNSYRNFVDKLTTESMNEHFAHIDETVKKFGGGQGVQVRLNPRPRQGSAFDSDAPIQLGGIEDLELDALKLRVVTAA